MNKIHKYTIPHGGGKVKLPSWWEFRPIQMQHGEITIWIEVDNFDEGDDRENHADLMKEEEILFKVVPTGGLVDEGWTYHATVQDGSFVWHIYEAAEEEDTDEDNG